MPGFNFTLSFFTDARNGPTASTEVRSSFVGTNICVLAHNPLTAAVVNLGGESSKTML
jgi:hypothetical protein